MPTWLLKREINRIMTFVCHDDKLLLEEGHHHNGCVELTGMEVLEACSFRGLPVDISLEEQRQCLTNHLKMVGTLREKLTPSNEGSEGLRLLTMHLAPLRHHLKQKTRTSREIVTAK
jgi:hypothetical protein